MPGFDGTGPAGRGAMTGGGRGICRGSCYYSKYPMGRGRTYWSGVFCLANRFRQQKQGNQTNYRTEKE